MLPPFLHPAALTATVILPGITVLTGLISAKPAICSIGCMATPILAQESRLQRIKFAPGSNSATVETAVVLGTRDRYLLNARQGQVLTLKISSVEKNALFDVLTPPNRVGQRTILVEGATRWQGRLPVSGDYIVVVGSTRGNATYKLQVDIK
ncbi:MAG TPA: hypothetical protein V6C46_04050 [Coleofasciculaceae cyanobacterium]